jgi:hypothetical protein
MKFAWYKYRQHTAGAVTEWRYIIISSQFRNVSRVMRDQIAEFLDKEGLLDTWSEHFRRVEIRPTNKIPKEVIENEIREIEVRNEDLRKKLKWLKKQT